MMFVLDPPDVNCLTGFNWMATLSSLNQENHLGRMAKGIDSLLTQATSQTISTQKMPPDNSSSPLIILTWTIPTPDSSTFSLGGGSFLWVNCCGWELSAWGENFPGGNCPDGNWLWESFYRGGGLSGLKFFCKGLWGGGADCLFTVVDSSHWNCGTSEYDNSRFLSISFNMSCTSQQYM